MDMVGVAGLEEMFSFVVCPPSLTYDNSALISRITQNWILISFGAHKRSICISCILNSRVFFSSPSAEQLDFHFDSAAILFIWMFNDLLE